MVWTVIGSAAGFILAVVGFLIAREIRYFLAEELLRCGRGLSFLAFDIMWRDGQDLRALPLVERKTHLRSILPKRSRVICEGLSVEGTGRKLFAAVVERDLEGIVAKRLADPYRPSDGRSRTEPIRTRNSAPTSSTTNGTEVADFCKQAASQVAERSGRRSQMDGPNRDYGTGKPH
jgi:ATP dependent DNA ligase-like protein